jgi:hypothetical protein
MAVCKHCGVVFDWGRIDDGWVPLVPVAEHDGLDRTHQDENGVLRAAHYLVCTRTGGPTVKVTKLKTPIKGSDILPAPAPKLDETVPMPQPVARRPIRRIRAGVMTTPLKVLKRERRKKT